MASRGGLLTRYKRTLYKRQDGICPLCLHPLADGRGVNIDHKIPRSRGGTDREDNLQLVHVGCNQHKADRPNQSAAWCAVHSLLLRGDGRILAHWRLHGRGDDGVPAARAGAVRPAG